MKGFVAGVIAFLMLAVSLWAVPAQAVRSFNTYSLTDISVVDSTIFASGPISGDLGEGIIYMEVPIVKVTGKGAMVMHVTEVQTVELDNGREIVSETVGILVVNPPEFEMMERSSGIVTYDSWGLLEGQRVRCDTDNQGVGIYTVIE